MIVEDVGERKLIEGIAVEPEIFPEREPGEGIHQASAGKVGYGVVEHEERRAGEHYAQSGVEVIDILNLLLPAGQTVNFVDKQVGDSPLLCHIGEVEKGMAPKPDVVKRHIESLVGVGESHFDALKHKGGFSDSTRALYPHQSRGPCDFIVEHADVGGYGMAQQLAILSLKSVH